MVSKVEKTSKTTVQDIIVDRLIKKIEEDGQLPWQRPFAAACMNWYSNHEYRGINKILLGGGEYITVNQLKEYNKKNKTSFWFEKGTPAEIVVLFKRQKRTITEKLADEISKDPSDSRQPIFDGEKWVISRWILRYYRVYDIMYMRDKEGNKLPSKLGNSVIEVHTPSDQIVSNYIKKQGVHLEENSGGRAFYQKGSDKVSMPPAQHFEDTEAYYRVLFHELVHSTGVETRLNRSCYAKYHDATTERSKEELVAEIGGLLLASEAGFRSDTQWGENSETYVAGWCNWMRNNKHEVISGVSMAEKAKEYILQGGSEVDELERESETSTPISD